jgi:hypothetical protein
MTNPFPTITADDWRRAIARERAIGRFEGNAMLEQIRAATNAELARMGLEPLAPEPRNDRP